MKDRATLRIIDANMNRLREALRVCEEVTRFSLDERGPTRRLKTIRHDVSDILNASKGLNYPSLIRSRDIKSDVGKATIPNELKRDTAFGVLRANLQRAKESARVLEEFSKLVDTDSSARFKELRFKIYDTEKKIIEKL